MKKTTFEHERPLLAIVVPRAMYNALLYEVDAVVPFGPIPAGVEIIISDELDVPIEIRGPKPPSTVCWHSEVLDHFPLVKGPRFFRTDVA